MSDAVSKFLLIAMRNHFPLLLTEDQVVMSLDGNKLREAFLLRQGIRLGDLPCKAVGDADVSGLSSLYDAVQAIHDIYDRRLPVPHVIDIQIHVVHAKILQACVDHVFDMLLAADAFLDLFLCSRQELGGDDHLVPLCKVPERSADILFTGAALIGDGCVFFPEVTGTMRS